MARPTQAPRSLLESAPVRLVDRVLTFLLIVFMTAMVVDVTVQVLSRFIGRPTSFTEELANYLMIWNGLLGSALALRRTAHLGLDLLTASLKGTARRLNEILIYSLVLLFGVAVLAGGIRLVDLAHELNQLSPMLRWKMAYVYSVIPATGGLFIFYALIFLADRFLGRAPAPAAAAQEPRSLD